MVWAALTLSPVNAGGAALSVVSYRTTSLSLSEVGGVIQRGPDGAIYFLRVEDGIVHRLNTDNSISRFQLSPTPETAFGTVDLLQDMHIDAVGNLSVPAIWGRPPKNGGVGVLVFDSAGRYLRTVSFTPGIGVRHIAVYGNGNVFALGIDPAYYRRTDPLCLLVHKYSPDGKRLTAFSSCPPELAGDKRTSGSGWNRLNQEVDRGRIWIDGSRLYHLLPFSHSIRVFDASTGSQVDDLELQGPSALEPPAAGGTEETGTAEMLWHVVRMTDGRYLARWSMQSGAPGAASVHPATSMTVHIVKGANGSTLRGGRVSHLGVIASSDRGAMVPVFAEEDGSVTCLVGNANGPVAFARVRISSN